MEIIDNNDGTCTVAIDSGVIPEPVLRALIQSANQRGIDLSAEIERRIRATFDHPECFGLKPLDLKGTRH